MSTFYPELSLNKLESNVLLSAQRVKKQWEEIDPEELEYFLHVYKYIGKEVMRVADVKGFNRVLYPCSGSDWKTPIFMGASGRVVTIDENDLMATLDPLQNLVAQDISMKMIDGYHVHFRNIGIAGALADLSLAGVDLASVEFSRYEQLKNLPRTPYGVSPSRLVLTYRNPKGETIEHIHYSGIVLDLEKQMTPSDSIFTLLQEDLADKEGSNCLHISKASDNGSTFTCTQLFKDGTWILADDVSSLIGDYSNSEGEGVVNRGLDAGFLENFSRSGAFPFGYATSSDELGLFQFYWNFQEEFWKTLIQQFPHLIEDHNFK